MRIAIIGAGISGLTAGRELAKAGHDVTIIEKSRGLGGRLATRYAGEKHEYKLDHGTPYFSTNSPEFSGFVSELLDKNLVKIWDDTTGSMMVFNSLKRGRIQLKKLNMLRLME
jgi:renalase